MKRAVASTVAIALAVILAIASPAGASGPYDSTSESAYGYAGAGGAAWTAAADMTAAGEFDHAATIAESGSAFDRDYGGAITSSSAENQFTLEPGEYTATVAYSALSFTLSSTGFGRARAQLALTGSGDADWLEWGGTVAQESVAGVAVPAGSVSNQSGSMWIRFTVAATSTFSFGARVDAQAFSGISNNFVEARGGTASASVTGQIDSITVAPV